MQRVQIYLDTNVFIEMFETKTEASLLLWSLFERAELSAIRFVTSELTLSEVLVKPLKLAHAVNDWQQVDDYRAVISNKADLQSVVPISRDVLDYAANIRALTPGIKLPDAIHLATAVMQKCDFFLSNDHLLAEKCLSATPLFPIRQFVHFGILADQTFRV